MSDPLITADNVAGWTYLGVDLPKPLTDAVNAYKAIRSVFIDDHPAFDASKVTADNAEQKVREFAESLTLTIKGTTGLSPLAEARKSALQWAARSVNARAGEAVPAIIEGLTPAFEASVSSLMEAGNDLPYGVRELTSDAVVNGGPSALAAYQSAKEATENLHRIEAWLDSLRELPAYAGFEPAGVLRVLAPETRAQVAHLYTARDNASSMAIELGPELWYAARVRMPFRINTPRDANELREELESQPVESTVKFIRF